MKNNILKNGLLAMLLFVYTLPAMAGPVDPPIDDDPLPAPIDNWMIFLAFAGIAIGVYLVAKYNKKAVA